ncbi:hypothetical protein CVCC1112_279 [Paenarthrobacter nicotinovorans]|nr:hypothetical protein CVCC1112_279 [Paenarthrobacter nicotinovorans]
MLEVGGHCRFPSGRGDESIESACYLHVSVGASKKGCQSQIPINIRIFVCY